MLSFCSKLTSCRHSRNGRLRYLGGRVDRNVLSGGRRIHFDRNLPELHRLDHSLARRRQLLGDHQHAESVFDLDVLDIERRLHGLEHQLGKPEEIALIANPGIDDCEFITPKPRYLAPDPGENMLEPLGKLYQQQVSQLAQMGMGEQEFRDWRKTALLASKVRSAIASTVPTVTDQIKFQYIRAAADHALTVTTDVNTLGFAAIYQEVVSGTYPITTVVASDTGGWVPQDAISTTTELGPVVAKELFATPISQTVAVINQSGSATYFAFIQDHQVGPLDSTYLQNQQQAAVEAWLAERRKSDFIFTWEDRVPAATIPNLPSSSEPIATP